MKKLICLLLVSVMMMSLSVGLVAQANEYTFIIEGMEISISGDLTEEEAYEIAYLHYCIENGIEVSDTYATCSHSYEYQTVIATTHRARTTSPRCQKFIYDIGTCSKCNDVVTKLVKTWYIACCD